MINTKKKTITL